jgi:hypothetical protein
MNDQGRVTHRAVVEMIADYARHERIDAALRERKRIVRGLMEKSDEEGAEVGALLQRIAQEIMKGKY